MGVIILLGAFTGITKVSQNTTNNKRKTQTKDSSQANKCKALCITQGTDKTNDKNELQSTVMYKHWWKLTPFKTDAKLHSPGKHMIIRIQRKVIPIKGWISQQPLINHFIH